jgi:hypothetical protein
MKLMPTIRAAMTAIGIGRPGETNPRHPRHRYLFRSLHLTPWSKRMRFGWALGWDGPYWHNAVGIAGPDWDGGDWLGGMSWHKHGPFVVCRWGRRGSLRGDRRFADAMGCTCPRHGLLWPIGHTHPPECPLHR